MHLSKKVLPYFKRDQEAMRYSNSECFLFKLKVYFWLQVAPAGSQGTQKYAVIKKTSQQPTTPSKSGSNAPWLPSSKDMQVN